MKDREGEELARFDLGCQWITGGLCPDHASLGRFIQLHDAKQQFAYDAVSDTYRLQHPPMCRGGITAFGKSGLFPPPSTWVGWAVPTDRASGAPVTSDQSPDSSTSMRLACLLSVRRTDPDPSACGTHRQTRSLNGPTIFEAMIEFFLQYAPEFRVKGPMRCHKDLPVLVERDLVGKVLEARIGNNVGPLHGLALVTGVRPKKRPRLFMDSRLVRIFCANLPSQKARGELYNLLLLLRKDCLFCHRSEYYGPPSPSISLESIKSQGPFMRIF